MKRYFFTILCPFLLQALPLDDFIAQEDPTYSWESKQVVEEPDAIVHTVRLSSQTWRSSEEATPILWQHWVKITVPRHLSEHPVALLHVGGGHQGDSAPATPAPLRQAVQESGAILIELTMVPNQPIIFADEQKGRNEDAIVAYSWKKFMATRDNSWPLHMPMAKAIVKAMDCAQKYLSSLSKKCDRFVLLGESKRGWASWMAAAADDRIIGIIPVCCDFLNVKQCFTHHFNSLGAWSPAIRDYTVAGIDESCIDLPIFDQLMELEDPYRYRERYTMPKYLILSAGDPFATPDASQFYYHGLPAKKYLRYIPNTGHSLASTDYLESIRNFFTAFVKGQRLPELTWDRTEKGILSIETDRQPTEISLWQATNEKSRDFRWDFTKIEWKRTPIPIASSGKYKVKLTPPKKGWTAYFVECKYGTSAPLTFTTQIFITPDELPHDLHKVVEAYNNSAATDAKSERSVLSKNMCP